MIRVRCPKCATALMLDTALAVGVVKCPDCGRRVTPAGSNECDYGGGLPRQR